MVAEDRKHLTVVGFASASGWSGNPMLITAGALSNNFLNDFIEGSIVRGSKSGWINDQLYIEWCSYFVEQIQHIRGDKSNWCLLVVYQHPSHMMNPSALKVLNEANVLSVSIPSHTSSF